MSRVKLDAATTATLKAAEPGAELVGADGAVLGAFVPPDLVPGIHRMLEARRRVEANAKMEVTKEMLDAIRNSGREPIPHEHVKLLLGLS